MVAVFGVHVEIRADDRALLDRVVERLPPGWTPIRSTLVQRTYRFVFGNMCRLYADDVLLSESNDLDELCDQFQSDFELFVAVHARTRVIVHAGVVGWRGRAIVIPGRSFSGKTTLVAALIGLGAEYFSDEYAVLDERGLAYPFPTPLAVRHGGGVRRTYRPEQMGATVGQSRLPIGLILVTTYEPSALWRPRKLTRGRGVLALLANSAAARHQPAFLLRTFREAVRGAVTLTGTRGEAIDLAHHLLTNKWEIG